MSDSKPNRLFNLLKNPLPLPHGGLMASSEEIIVVVISDTHMREHQIKIPKCHLLIHAGDATGLGKPQEIEQVANWFKWLLKNGTVKEIIFTPGNHDRGFELDKKRSLKLMEHPNIHVLIDETIELYGYKFHGSPWTPKFFDWSFMDDEDKLYERWKKTIPRDVDVLITHGPPRNILDDNPLTIRCGSQALRDIVLDIKPLYHIFGHIHHAYGMKILNETIFINAACLNDKYILKNSPITFELK